MSSLSSRPTPPSVIALQAVARARSAQNEPAVPSAAQCRRRSPYAVERYPTAGEAVRLVGFDKDGLEVIVDITIPRHRFKPNTMAKLQRWMMAEDQATPPLSLI